jgi:hypothetical protein
MPDGVTDDVQSPLDNWHGLSPEERVEAFKQLPYAEKTICSFP